MGTCFDSSISLRDPLDCVCCRIDDSMIHVTEEQREERRKVWWLLYIVDRHLSFCFHRPTVLSYQECEDLLLPLDEEPWQAGDIHSNSSSFSGPKCLSPGHKGTRNEWPNHDHGDTSMLGFFLSLATILGRILDLNQTRSRLRPESHTHLEQVWTAQRGEVLFQLKEYESSIEAWKASVSKPRVSLSPLKPTETTENKWLAQTMRSYALYYIEVSRSLLTAMEHPVPSQEQQRPWITPSKLTSAMPHLLKSADSLRQILSLDPDLSFMPFFFGHYLLRSGFFFLDVLEKQQDKGEPMLSACEVVLRAAESFFITMNVWYLRDLCQIMRSALGQARGRPVSLDESRQRHTARLNLYRWAFGENNEPFELEGSMNQGA